MMWIIAGVILVLAGVMILGLSGVFGPSVESLASSADPADRQAAVERLSERGTESSARLLSALAADRDPETARLAVRGLGQVQTQANLDALTRILDNNKLSKNARAEAGFTIGKFKAADPKVLTERLSVEREPDPVVRAGVAKGLARMEMPSTIPQLSAALEDPNPEVRRWAISAIHRMVIRTFPYDADKPPQDQQAVIQKIREYLRKVKVL